jgi:dTDP-4-amino-4,6-dideoxygalactose transaminase
LRIPLTKPALAFDEVAHLLRTVLDSGRLTSGPQVEAFEAEIAAYVGTRQAVATSSATTALHLVLAAAGIGAGDEVLVSDFTYPATGNAIAQTGATPVPVDCAPASFCIDVDDAERRVTARTRALMVVDPFGEPADLVGAEELARRHGLLLVEDAACALGAGVGERRCGAWGAAGCFSFHPRKIITTGEGGMVMTDDDDLGEQLRLLRNHGGVAATVGQRFERHGFNYRLSELNAALGRVQLDQLDELVAARRSAAAIYADALDAVDGVSAPDTSATSSTFQSFVVELDDAIDRDDVVGRLAAAGVETTLGTYAMHAQPSFAPYGYSPGDLPRSWQAQQHSLTLPLWPHMPAETIGEVVAALTQTLEAAA